MILLRPAAVALALLLASCGRQWVAPNFRLTDDAGMPWMLAGQRGKTVVLTFGFTHCADTCPATIAKLARIANALRDTPPALHRFLARFNAGSAHLSGLTGSPSQIDAVERAYHVWAQRVPGRQPSSYDVTHSAAIYFIDANGRIRALHDDDDSDAVLSAALREATS
jgi:protein SCO1